MYGFSTVDGFLDVNQGVEEMIKYLANEPSVGLFFLQQHAQNAMPNVLHLKDKLVEKTHEVILHTEDSEDSICALRSMTECGLPVVDEMIKDINKTLYLISTTQPHKGLLGSSRWSFQMGRSNSEASTALSSFAVCENQDGGNRNYLSAVLNSVKQKATGLRWPQIDSVSEAMAASSSSSSALAASGGIATTYVGSEVEELPLSSGVLDVHFDEDDTTSGSTIHDTTSNLDNFEEFRYEQEAKLKQWLEEFDKQEAPAEKLLDKHEAQAEKLP